MLGKVLGFEVHLDSPAAGDDIKRVLTIGVSERDLSGGHVNDAVKADRSLSWLPQTDPQRDPELIIPRSEVDILSMPYAHSNTTASRSDRGIRVDAGHLLERAVPDQQEPPAEWPVYPEPSGRGTSIRCHVGHPITVGPDLPLMPLTTRSEVSCG
jgi:hypothetical protein